MGFFISFQPRENQNFRTLGVMRPTQQPAKPRQTIFGIIVLLILKIVAFRGERGSKNVTFLLLAMITRRPIIRYGEETCSRSGIPYLQS
jgi:hypothetical protein